jgi:hypothetical protein
MAFKYWNPSSLPDGNILIYVNCININIGKFW